MKKQTWEDCRGHYGLLLEGLNDLIDNTARLSEGYKQAHFDFAEVIYENELTQIMDKAGQLQKYERGFEFLYYTLQGQTIYLKQLHEIINLLLVKDPVSCPHN